MLTFDSKPTDISSTVIYAVVVSVIVLSLFGVSRQFLTRNPLDNIPGPQATSWWKGNLHQLFDSNGWQFHEDTVENYGTIVKTNGLLGSKELYVSDPLALHHIIIKDQYVFEKFQVDLTVAGLLFGPGLLSTSGEIHRKQRRLLNPVFHISHIRNMAPTFYRVTNQLRDLLAIKVKDGPQDINVLVWLTHVALELVGQSGLGYTFDILREGAVSSYAEAIKSLLPTIFELSTMLPVVRWCAAVGSPGFRRFIVDIMPNKTIQKIKNMVDIMDRTSTEIYESKASALQQGDEAVLDQVDQGKDILSILLRANPEASAEERLDESEVLGQMSSFIFAAMDTTSSALSRLLQLLAQHPDVQERLRHEVVEAHKGGELSYDDLDKLPYLDAVCRETLRLYCPVPFVVRTAREDRILPLSTPVKGVDGSDIREIHVPKNTQVYVGIMAVNRSKSIWGEDAREWKPERWLARLPDSVSQAHIPGMYSHMMTFMGGGRACIGFKFAELEMKIILAVLIQALRFSPTNADITWRLGGVNSPSIKGFADKEAGLILKVESVARPLVQA